MNCEEFFFEDEMHKLRFELLKKKDSTFDADSSRNPLFYMLSLKKELMDNIDNVYDFKKHKLKKGALCGNFKDENQYLLTYLGCRLYSNEPIEYSISLIMSKLTLSQFRAFCCAMIFTIKSFDTIDI